MNGIQRALALAEPGEALAPAHFSDRLSAVLEPIELTVQPEAILRETFARIEAWLIRRTLEAHGGRRAETPGCLSIPPMTSK